jgi:hypothetical protein
MLNNFFQKSRCYEMMGKKAGRAIQAKDDNRIQCMCFVPWIHKAINIHSEYVKPIASPQQQWSLKCCVIRTLPVMFVQKAPVHTDE